MSLISDFFYITVSADKMAAEIHCKETYENIDMKIDSTMLIDFLKENRVIYGLDDYAINLVLRRISSQEYPIVIAKGKYAKNGTDGKIAFYQSNSNSSEITRGKDWNFREVMQIPTVKKGDKLATISLPTKEENGMNVEGVALRARPGKSVSLKAGKGVVYKDADRTFYADTDGQINVTDRSIQIDDVYVVEDTISMKTGNLDFVGSIVIKGDVPTGYTVRAAGDIKIHGIVEAANVISGGSIYIAEGLSGLKKGFLKADRDIHIGYINQGIVEAGRSIYVENSITHSECTAKTTIFCQHGNVIGGSLSVGKSIEANDIGNRLSTETAISIGLNKVVNEEQTELENRKKELTIKLKQLEAIGKKITESKTELDAKTRITMLRQRRSHEQLTEAINIINENLGQMDAHLGSEDEAQLIVKNHLHPNVTISFGKYKRRINKPRHNVQLNFNNNDIVIHALKN